MPLIYYIIIMIFNKASIVINNSHLHELVKSLKKKYEWFPLFVEIVTSSNNSNCG